jgi:phosphohistidine phosphatase
MNLYLLRHGEAQVHAADDSLRPLTPRGREDVRMVARQFTSKGVTLDRCLVSPFLRAQQTVAEFLSELHSDIPIETQPWLTPQIRATEAIQHLQTLNANHVLIVSHNPLLSELHALLTEGSISEINIMGTSELVCVSLDIVALGMGVTPYRLLPSDYAWHD